MGVGVIGVDVGCVVGIRGVFSDGEVGFVLVVVGRSVKYSVVSGVVVLIVFMFFLVVCNEFVFKCYMERCFGGVSGFFYG